MLKKRISALAAAVLALTLALPIASADVTNPADPDYNPLAPENDPYAKVTYGTGFTPTSSLDFSSPMCYDPEEGDLSYIDATPTARFILSNQPHPVPGQAVLLKTPQVNHDLGPNYYVQTSVSNYYSGAFARVLLPQVSNLGGYAPFIALGVAGAKGGIDLGVTYENGRWIPYYYDTSDEGKKFAPYSYFKGNTQGAVYAVLSIAVEGRNLQWSIEFQDANYQTLSTFWRELQLSVTSFAATSIGPTLSFYRFASLSPAREGSAASTGTAVMENGAFIGCQLYDGFEYVPWGMGDDTAAYVWQVRPNRMDLSYSGTTDTFSIRY